ncbi:gag polymerase env [Lasallia pustulata]|uniref:Gag polymerase env n=1 Tax=Lasallia pustulata TaxID=136370 RepID=A0A1W5D1K5_9LECA|nr:gag polymerase env [Lasallia pustulata]
MSELDKQLAGSKDDVHLNEISEMTEEEKKDLRTKVPREFHDFLDVFDKKAAESRLYPMSQFKLEKIKEYLEENLRKGFITPSNAPYASPILFAQKSNGDLQFYVHYQKLNALTKKDRYPLPLIDETLARMSGFPGSKDLTTFITSMGLYKYRVLPFGLTNGPASYQHYMNNILLPYLNDFVQAYLDDIIIYSKTRKEHTQHVQTVLGKLREAGLQVDIKKSKFFVQETTFLGLVISTEGLKMDPQKIKAIAQWPIPIKLVEVQSFIGFCNFYRRFIKEFSKIACPLTRLAQNDTPFEWNEACQIAFDTLKKRMTEAPVLRHFDRSRKLYLEADSSDYVNGGILLQKDDDGVLHPVAFYSKNLLPAECNYEIYDKELLVII